MQRIFVLICLSALIVQFAAAQAVAPAPPEPPRAEVMAVQAPVAPALPRVEVVIAQAPVPAVPPVPPAAPAPVPAPHPVPAIGFEWHDKGSYLGIGVQEITPDRARELKLSEERGVEVTTVTDDSPAGKAGLREGDVVLEYNGQRVEGVEQFVRMVRETPVGRRVKLLISRNGANQTIVAAVAERKPFHMDPGFDRKMRDELREQLGPDSKFQRDMQKMQDELGSMNFNFDLPDVPQGEMVWKTRLLGIDAESVGPQLAEFFGVKQGVLVRSVDKDSLAEKAGLKAGDVIVKVGNVGVGKPSDVTRQLRQAPAGKHVALSVVRNRQQMSMNVTVESKPAAGARGPRHIQRLERHDFLPAQPQVRGRLVAFPGDDF